MVGRLQAGKMCVLGRLGREKRRATGGGVQRWLLWAEGTRHPFLLPAAVGGDARWQPVAPERKSERA